MTDSCSANPNFPRARFVALLALAVAGGAFVLSMPWLVPIGSGKEDPLLLFLGRFHPLVVHLPIGLLLLAALFDVLARFRAFAHLRPAILTILLCAALAAALAVFHGCLLAAGAGDTSEALDDHLWAGVALALFLFALLPIHVLAHAGCCRIWAFGYRLALWFSVLLLSIASHLGGNLTHGPDYLVKYMPAEMKTALAPLPAPIREFIGLPAATPVAQFTLYDALLAPAFENHCVACHNEAKPKGGLRMDSLAELMKGGDTGPAISLGNLAKSEVHRRVSLPMDDDEFMPPDGKKPMSKEALALLTWWIESAKPGETLLSELGTVPSEVQSAIDAFLAKQAQDGASAESAGKPSLEAQLAAINADLNARLMPISRRPEDGVMLVTAGLGATFDDAGLAKIAPVAEHLRDVDLSRTGVTDGGLAVLGKAVGVRQLRLDNTQIGSSGIAMLRPMQKLEVLNLYGTAIDDQAIDSLATLGGLRRLYIAQTKISLEGQQKLARALPQCVIVANSTPEAADTKAPTAATAAPAPPAAQ